MRQRSSLEIMFAVLKLLGGSQHTARVTAHARAREEIGGQFIAGLSYTVQTSGEGGSRLFAITLSLLPFEEPTVTSSNTTTPEEKEE